MADYERERWFEQMAGAWLDYVLRRGWSLLTPEGIPPQKKSAESFHSALGFYRFTR